MANITGTIAITTYNESKNIGRCLRSVFKQRDIDRFRVVVVDGNSKDGTLGVTTPFLKHKNFSVHKLKTNEWAAQRNWAINNSVGDWIIFISADTILGKQWLSGYIEEMGRCSGQVVGIAGKFNNSSNIYTKIMSMLYWPGLKYRNAKYFSTVNCAIRRSFLSKNNFDKTIKAGEDKDLALSIIDKGFRISYKNCFLTHCHTYTIPGFLRKITREFYYFLKIGEKYGYKYDLFGWGLLYYMLISLIIIVGFYLQIFYEQRFLGLTFLLTLSFAFALNKLVRYLYGYIKNIF